MHERNARFVSNEDEAPVASVSREEDDVDAARTPRRRHDKPLGHPLKRRAAHRLRKSFAVGVLFSFPVAICEIVGVEPQRSHSRFGGEVEQRLKFKPGGESRLRLQCRYREPIALSPGFRLGIGGCDRRAETNSGKELWQIPTPTRQERAYAGQPIGSRHPARQRGPEDIARPRLQQCRIRERGKILGKVRMRGGHGRGSTTGQKQGTLAIASLQFPPERAVLEGGEERVQLRQRRALRRLQLLHRGDLLNDLKRIGNATRPKGIPERVDLTTDFAVKHGPRF